MKNIDFLPSRYRERDARRQATIWRITLLLSFGGFLCAATIAQVALKRTVQASLAEHKKTYAAAKLKTERQKALELKLANLEERAELYTYLRHPWPRTQLLLAVVNGVPDTTVLEELSISQSQEEQSAGSTAGHFTAPEGKQASTTDPPHQDLEFLRKENDLAQTTIQISGTASDTAALNQFVSALGQSSLFQCATLTSLEASNEPGQQGYSKFQVNIIVRPGYGQPGGPDSVLIPVGHAGAHESGETL